jgi:septal ring factor EnvC (AmiA/AmiB activator)
MRRPRRCAALASCALVAWALASQAGAQDPAGPRQETAPSQPTPADLAAERASDRAAEMARREAELRAIQERIAASAENRRRLADEIDAIKSDRAKLNEALLGATARAQAAEERIAGVAARLDLLTGSETALRRSLEARRETVSAVLAALQRIGRRPPPAMLVRPEDILAAVRSSVLLGSVLPELRDETTTLASDLAELVRLRRSIATERDALTAEATGLASEQTRLSALVQARQQRLSAAEAETSGERARAESLAFEAKSLKELVERMEGEVTSAERAAQEARRAAEIQAQQVRQQFAAAAFRDPARLAPKLPFAEAKGMLPKPASGATLRRFGDPDTLGGTMRGLAIATGPRAVVSSAADGWVVFAGTFRSFGRLLIINAGSGDYLLFAGMNQISVEVGQFVLAGEPVGQMGEVASPSAALGTVEAGSPVLYVEFRKDGVPVDPGPWWAKSQGEKVRG